MTPLYELPEWDEACRRYRNDIKRFAVEALRIDVTPQQALLFDCISAPGARVSVASGHGTGKSRSAGVVALWHLLFYPESVMLFTAPQIGQLKTVVWKEIDICLQRLRMSDAFSWLADYVVSQAEKIYIKGFSKTWFVFAKTAPKHQPTNIAGQHGDHYTVWVDEACGVSDEVLNVAFGALTHANNRAVMTSQPATNVGIFFDSHHDLSYKNGGVWISLEFNGEESPLVSYDKLKEALYQYGGRDHPEYMIRIRGKFPELRNTYLLARSDINAMLKRASAISDTDRYGYMIAVDVGGNVGRDSSVITVAKVVDKDLNGEIQRHTHVVDIPLFSNSADIDMLLGKIDSLLQDYPGATLIVDPIGAGMGLCQKLKAKGTFFYEVQWGGAPFNNDHKKRFSNKRTQAYVTMTKSVQRGIFTIDTQVAKAYKVKNNLNTQLSRLPYSFDDMARWVMMSKKDMKLKNIDSPDLADTWAFIYIDNIQYSPANDAVYQDATSAAEDDPWGDLEKAAEEALRNTA